MWGKKKKTMAATESANYLTRLTRMEQLKVQRETGGGNRHTHTHAHTIMKRFR